MAGAMGATAKTMAAVNKQVKVEDVARTMQTFERESAKMDMTGEMSMLCLVWCGVCVMVTSVQWKTR